MPDPVADPVGATYRCGSWPSPISADLVAATGVRVEAVAVSGDDVWWQETRPLEQGRAVLVSASGDRLPPPWSARSRVHEYGGGSWWFGRDHAYFVEAEDQAVYRIPIALSTGGEPTPERVSAPAPTDTEWRFADGREHPDGSLIVCVREAHRSANDHEEPANELVAIRAERGAEGQPQVLVTGPDFVSDPRISPDGTHISWIQWNHPNMPWNETELKVAPLTHGGEPDSISVGPSTTVASGVAVSGPDWTADGRLVYSTDGNGFWNLRWWRTDGAGGALTDLMGAEIGSPAWVFGTRRWVELPDGRLVAVVTRDAVDTLSVVESDGTLRPVRGFGSADGFGPQTPVAVGSIAAAGPSAPTGVFAITATPTGLPEITRIDVDSGSVAVIRPAAPVGVDAGWLSVPESIWFDSEGRSIQAFFYRPTAAGDAFTVDGAEKPPLIVIGHGGPTAHNGPELSLKIQYWTSRGFAVVDVNYGGSTGFGKEYRDRLFLSWGDVDVDDCINAAVHLAAEGLVDGSRLAIRGSSSGGLTVLAALIRSDRFAAGVSLYGVADLKALAADTHKFESRYLDWLIGPYPEEIERYESRSPVNDATAITTPMLLMQGTEDRVVPPSQSEAVVGALTANEVDHVYVTFAGESHGFRRAESIVSSLELELWFYGQVFGFAPADPVTVPDSAIGRGFGLDLAVGDT